MVEIVKYQESNKKEWDEFCKNSKNSTFLFQRDYMEYHKEVFEDASVLVLNKGKIVALFPCSKDKDKIISHGGLTYGGLITKPDMRTPFFLDIFENLLSYFSALLYSSFIVKPLPSIFSKMPAQELEYALFLKNAKLIKRELSTVIHFSERGKLSKGRKWIINKAKRSDIRVSESEDFKRFLVLQNTVLEKHEALAVHQAHELEYLREKFPKNIKLIFAESSSNELLAAALLFVFDNVVHTQYLATSEQGKEVGALDLLIESKIQDYKDQKQEFFNFGISTTDRGYNFNEGLCQQKESFGGSAIVIDTYEIKLT